MTREERRAVWRERLAEQAASGLSVWAWCAREGVSYAGLLRWRRRLDEGLVQAPLSWIRLDEGAMPEQRLAVHVGAARIEVGWGFDPLLLRRVVDALATA